MPGDQLVPYWNRATQRFEGPNSTPETSLEVLAGVQAAATTVAALPLGIASRPGYVQDVRVAAITPATGNATYTVDIKKNGVSVLTGVVTLNNTETARQSVVGVLTAAAAALGSVAAGDFFEAAIVATVGTGTLPANIVFQVTLGFN